MNRKRPSSVFVPYESKNGIIRKVNDLPRFVEPDQVMKFLLEHKDLSHRLLDWREEFDADSISEYMSEVGEADRPLPRLIEFVEKKH